MSRARCEQCGRPARAFVRGGQYRSRKARAGQPRAVKWHTLCPGCWEKEEDRRRAERLREAS